jgi:hypothetical protein
MTSEPWSREELAEAVRLRQRAKMDFPLIAERLGRSLQAVRTKLSQVGRFVITGDDSLPRELGLQRVETPRYEPEEVEAARARLAVEIAEAKREAPSLARRGMFYRPRD